jgi:PAS domain S-box-containing protein
MNNEKEAMRILLVEESGEQCSKTEEYIKLIPGRNFHINCVYQFDDALQRMTNNECHIYFVDYQLNGKSGMDLLTQAIQAGCEGPIILLSTSGNHEMDIKAMESGAYDYLAKSDLNTENLERCIRYSLGRSSTLSALKASERKYRSIFEKARDIVFIASEDFKIVDINYAINELLAYDQEELLFTDFSHFFVNKKDYSLCVKLLEDHGEFSSFQADLVSKNGEIKNCIISASIEINNEGVTYIQGIIHDNTNQKRAEKSLVQSEKLAATSRLVRTLAHEVRNPLNNINLSLDQLMQNIGEDAEAKIYLDIVQRNSRRIGDLITELLGASRLDADMNFIKGSLQTVINQAVGAAHDRLTLKNIKLNISLPKEPLYITMDEEKLTLAFLNIIINAIEAMEKGKGNLSVCLKSGKSEYQVQIKDNGCGISEENLQKLYEPYFTSKRNGMGLGLANTINIMQSHNAQIDVNSTVGLGTTFTLTFNKTS